MNQNESPSSDYKKARRQYFKTTKNRPPDVGADWSPFRATEKMYKARFPPPDLSNVLDLATLDDTRKDEITRGGWIGHSDCVQWEEIPIIPSSMPTNTRCYTIPRIPGANDAVEMHRVSYCVIYQGLFFSLPFCLQRRKDLSFDSVSVGKLGIQMRQT